MSPGNLLPRILVIVSAIISTKLGESSSIANDDMGHFILEDDNGLGILNGRSTKEDNFHDYSHATQTEDGPKGPIIPELSPYNPYKPPCFCMPGSTG